MLGSWAWVTGKVRRLARLAMEEKARARQTAKRPWQLQEAVNRAPNTDMLPPPLAEDRAKELRHNLYIAEMHEAGQAAPSPFGLGRVAELLSYWKDEPTLRGWEWYFLHGLCHQDLLTVSVSTDPVESVAWSSDGTRLVTLSKETEPKIWDAATGKESAILAGPKIRDFSTASWSPDGTLLASGKGAEVMIWDAATKKQRLRFQGSTSDVRSIAWAADGARLALGSLDGTVRVADAATGKAIHDLKSNWAQVTALAWSRDGKSLVYGACADADSNSRLWRVGIDGKQEPELLEMAGFQASTPTIAPVGNRLVFTRTVSNLDVWRYQIGGRPEPFLMMLYFFHVVSLHLHPCA